MDKIVVDTNIVFSALLNIDSRIGQMIINGNFYYDFFAPEFIKDEIFRYREKIKTFGNLNEDDFIELYDLVLRKITILNHSLIPTDIYKKAEQLCKNIDIDDTIFVAITEFTNGKLWTGDKVLLKGLVNKGFRNAVTTEELYQDFIYQRRKFKF